MRLICLSLLVLGTSATVFPEGITRLVTYTSPVDASEQAYGVYIPPGAPPPGGYPVVLHTHGYGWSVSTSFSQWQTAWADAHRWILVQLNARGPNFYWGIGDVATWEVVDDLDARFGIDRRRVYITGGSMGGTGAFRQGVAHPDRIAAAVGVDGWTDFREWHWHWYARKDQRHCIEEFRRPLLEMGSPLYIAERARWGDIHIIADGKDTVVYPEQGIRMAERLMEMRVQEPDAYEAGLTFHPDKGHGGGYDVTWIYDYFLGRSAHPEQASVRVASPVLDYGELYWTRMERLHIQGKRALLDATARECDHGETAQDSSAACGVVDVITSNLDAFTLHLPLSSAADCRGVRVHVDGIPAYEGPPRSVSFEATRDLEDGLAGWVEMSGPPPAGFHKTRELCGPVGRAFVGPFVVAYGSMGPAALQRRHHDEATAFCRGWNGFMVRADALEAVSEDDLSPADLATRNLVLYGTLDSSRLLRRAQALHPMPVEVHGDRIVVRDPLTGDREYRGARYGAFTVYPNPLSHGRTYLVVVSGRFATTADGKAPQGLEYDLEKLAWAYPDYVVFNTDQGDLPHVMNVNNKPPVTCYEPGYFVEAGYHDSRWRPDRFATLDRVRQVQPEGVELVRVAEVRVQVETEAAPVPVSVDGEPQDPPRERLSRPAPVARVKIVDSGGRPVRQARVTGRWAGLDADSLSRPTLSDGVAYFPYPHNTWVHPLPGFRVINVMVTGAVYDFEADAPGGSAWAGGDGPLQLRPQVFRSSLDPQNAVMLTARAANVSAQPLEITGRFIPPHGQITRDTVPDLLPPGREATLQFRWLPDPEAPAGLHRGRFQVSWSPPDPARPGGYVETAGLFNVPPGATEQIALFDLAGRDITHGEPYRVTARVRNSSPSQAHTLEVTCSIVEDHRHLETLSLTLEPGATADLAWEAGPDETPLPVGEYQARVTVLGAVGVSRVAPFAVRR